MWKIVFIVKMMIRYKFVLIGICSFNKGMCNYRNKGLHRIYVNIFSKNFLAVFLHEVGHIVHLNMLEDPFKEHEYLREDLFVGSNEITSSNLLKSSYPYHSVKISSVMHKEIFASLYAIRVLKLLGKDSQEIRSILFGYFVTYPNKSKVEGKPLDQLVVADICYKTQRRFGVIK